jgi:hypothetical protein
MSVQQKYLKNRPLAFSY